MKHTIYKRYKTGRKKGGQRYMVGKKNYGSSKISKLMGRKTIAVPVAHDIPGHGLATPTRFSVLDNPYDYNIKEIIIKKPISKQMTNELSKHHNVMQIIDEKTGLPVSYYDATIERAFAKDQFRKKAGLTNKRMGKAFAEFIERRNKSNAYRGIRKMLKENYGSFGYKKGILREGGNEEVAEARRLGMKMKTPEAAIRAVRLTFDKPEELECVEASCALLDPVRKFYPDAELAKLSVKRPGTDATESHTVIISDKANKIIDSQVGQFKGRLNLPNDFIEKGIYDLKEYSQKVPFAYAERIDDDKKVDLFKILKAHE